MRTAIFIVLCVFGLLASAPASPNGPAAVGSQASDDMSLWRGLVQRVQVSGCQQCQYEVRHCESLCYSGNVGGYMTVDQCLYKCSVAGQACMQRFCQW